MTLGKGFKCSYTIIQFHVKTLEEEASQQVKLVSLIGAKRRLRKDM
jgi:hypothetical protein